MSGTTIVRHLLANYSALTDVVPATRIQCGVLPLDIDMPAISIRKISGFRFNNLAVTTTSRLFQERVQVTILAKDVEGTTPKSGYDLAKELLPLVLAACPLSFGTVNGIACKAVVADIQGPDLYDDETLIYEQSQDFIVRYTQ
jgi:hypothetical protein